MLSSFTNVTTARTTRISAAPTVQPISRRVLPGSGRDGVLARAEAKQRVEQGSLDADEDHESRCRARSC